MIAEFDTALKTLVGDTLPGVPLYGNFEPRANLTSTIIARLRFNGFTKADHRISQSSVSQQWAIDLQADQALADSTVPATMDGYLDDLIGALLGATLTGTFDQIKIDSLAAGINDAESAVQYTIFFSFSAVIRRA